jgi:hypothetical protein
MPSTTKKKRSEYARRKLQKRMDEKYSLGQIQIAFNF